jgi:hypothetical protein
MLLNLLLLNTLSLRSSLDVRDQVSHPYKTSGKIIVLYILIFKFWIATWRTKYSAPNDSKHSLTAICSFNIKLIKNSLNQTQDSSL